MRLLTDKEIACELYQKNILKLKTVPSHDDADSPIQPASLDLHVGKIFVPERPDHQLGSTKTPKRHNHPLAPGETALIETEESLHLPSHITAVVFPPASMTSQGILMTNPGIIDPGYNGHLSAVLINMSKETFDIKKGGIVFSALIFDLEKSVGCDYSARRGESHTRSELALQENYEKLNQDFLQIENRIDTQIREAISNLQFRLHIVYAVIVAIGIAIGSGSYWAAQYGFLDGRTDDLSEITEDTSKDAENNKEKIKALREKLSNLQSKNAKTPEDK